MYLYVLNSFIETSMHRKKSKREIESTQNNSSGKINVGIKRYTVINHKGPTRHTCTCKVLNI